MDSGFIYAILTGIFFGLHGVLGKSIGKKRPVVLITWANFAFALPYLLLMLYVNGIPKIIWQDFWWAVLVSFIVNIIAWNLFFRALKTSNLSHTMPFTAFTPIFLIPVAFFLLSELPDRRGLLGLFLILTGGYGIHLKSGDWLAPLKSLFVEKGTRYMLIVSAIWSFSAAAEKVAVLSSSPIFYSVVIYLLITIAYLPFVNFKAELSKEKPASLLPMFLLLGLVSAATVIFQFTALKTILVSYVIAFKRGGIIISVLLGFIIYREKNPLRNLTFSLVIIAGMFLMIF